MRFLKENGNIRDNEYKFLQPTRNLEENGKLPKTRAFGKEITNLFAVLKGNYFKDDSINAQVSVKLKEFYDNYKEKALLHLNEIDKLNLGKLYDCSEYANEIYNYLKEREAPFLIKFGSFLKIQTEVHEKMRECLIDWLVEIHRKFKLLPETLYMTVSLIDRVFAKEKIQKSKLQCLGLASLFIAGKYEEIYPPDLRDYVNVANYQVGKDEILKMERQILKILEFDLSCPSIYIFLQRYSRLLKTDETQFSLAEYLSESQFLDTRMFKYPPSLIAASCLYLSSKILNKDCWNSLIEEQSKYSESEVKSCAGLISKIPNIVENQGFLNIKTKFMSTKYKEVGRMKIEI